MNPSATRAAARGDARANLARRSDLPWVPSGTPGKAAMPLRFMGDAGFVELLRMQPGTVMPLHRHTGEVHVLHLSGERLLGSGERVGPGDYVYEPAGNVDWWKVVGDEALVAFVVVMGKVEFFGPDGSVRYAADSAGQLAAYERYCAAHGIAVQPLAPDGVARVVT